MIQIQILRQFCFGSRGCKYALDCLHQIHLVAPVESLLNLSCVTLLHAYFYIPFHWPEYVITTGLNYCDFLGFH